VAESCGILAPYIPVSSRREQWSRVQLWKMRVGVYVGVVMYTCVIIRILFLQCMYVCAGFSLGSNFL